MKLKQCPGFTLVELLVVISLIALFASLAIGSMNNVRQQTLETRAALDLEQIQKAALELALDSNVYPGGYSITNCEPPGTEQAYANGVYLDDPRSGLAESVDDPAKYPNWRGPYVENASEMTDPWGQRYIMESHYQCTAGEYAVEKGYCNASEWVYGIISGGPNGSGLNQYDADNIAIVLCRRN